MKEMKTTALILGWLCSVIVTYGLALAFFLSSFPLSSAGEKGCASAVGTSVVFAALAPISTVILVGFGAAGSGIYYTCHSARSANDIAE